MASSLPDDAMKEILTRLPVKTLLRSRSVSKRFLSLIDSPDFIKRHLRYSLLTKSNHKLILRSSNLHSVSLSTLDKTSELNHPLKSISVETKVYGSVNGLLCLYNGDESIVIWNFATGNYQNVPVSEIGSVGTPEALSPVEFVTYGFGYDSVSDDYKILRLVQFYGDDFDSFHSEAKVYSLRSNSWRRIQDFPYFLCDHRRHGELVCGALHWEVSSNFGSDSTKLIAAFDLSTNEYKQVAMPDLSQERSIVTQMDGSLFTNLKEFDGRLCVLCFRGFEAVDVWMMREYGVKESWTKLFTVSQPKVIRKFKYVVPYAFSRSGDEILLVQDGKKLLWYSLEEEKVRVVNLQGCPDHFEAAICVESLVPLSGRAEDYAKKRGGEGAKKKQNKDGKKRDGFLSQGFKLKL